MPVLTEEIKVWAALVPQPSTIQLDEEEPGDDGNVAGAAGLDWCGHGVSHVDFERHEPFPLSEGKFLGHGAQGAVYSTECQGGELVAWKKIYCPRGISQTERREISVLKRLNHKHIIKLVGSYTRKPYLGLLLWPVAITDLASFLDGVDGFTTHQASTLSPDAKNEAQAFIKELVGIQEPANLLRQSIGCLASAVVYLHGNSVRHKDLKPANILLYSDGLRLTDFGSATDFSDFSRSATEGGDRGTPKYFSPETSALESCGRASDIFSLGCVFLEMLAVANGCSLERLKQSRPDKDRSFQANLEHVQNWIETVDFMDSDKLLVSQIRLMLNRAPQSRPTVQDVQHRLKCIEVFFDPRARPVYHGKCCNSNCFPLLYDALVPNAEEVNLDLVLDDRTSRPSWTVSVMPQDRRFVERLVLIQVCGSRMTCIF
jgi:serine/threonine protein kinase